MMREEVQVNKEIRGVQVDKRGVTCQGETRKGGYRLRCDCNKKNQMRERENKTSYNSSTPPAKWLGYLVREKRVDPSPIFNCRRTSCCSLYVHCCQYHLRHSLSLSLCQFICLLTYWLLVTKHFLLLLFLSFSIHTDQL